MCSSLTQALVVACMLSLMPLPVSEAFITLHQASLMMLKISDDQEAAHQPCSTLEYPPLLKLPITARDWGQLSSHISLMKIRTPKMMFAALSVWKEAMHTSTSDTASTFH